MATKKYTEQRECHQVRAGVQIYVSKWNGCNSYRLSSYGAILCSCLQSSPTEKALANQFLAPGRTPTIANERMSATKTVHMQTKARCTGEMRDELLGTVRRSVCFGLKTLVNLIIQIAPPNTTTTILGEWSQLGTHVFIKLRKVYILDIPICFLTMCFFLRLFTGVVEQR